MLTILKKNRHVESRQATCTHPLMAGIWGRPTFADHSPVGAHRSRRVGKKRRRGRAHACARRMLFFHTIHDFRLSPYCMSTFLDLVAMHLSLEGIPCPTQGMTMAFAHQEQAHRLSMSSWSSDRTGRPSNRRTFARYGASHAAVILQPMLMRPSFISITARGEY